MTTPKRPPANQPPGRRDYPNRIVELMKARGLTYDKVAAVLNDGTHSKTIGALATGNAELTYSWMQRLGRVFGVKASEIIEAPARPDNLISVPVVGKLQAGAWSERTSEFEQAPSEYVSIPNSPALRGLQLYARTIEGLSMNKLYAPGSVVVLSRLMQRPGEILAGKRYHVRRTRGDLIEETIKTLVLAANGEYWLQPESDSPEFAAFKLEGVENETVELLGRVRYAITSE